MILLYVLLGLVTVLYTFVTWNHGYWKKKGIPHISPLPGFGNMLDTFISRRSSTFILVDLYQKFPNAPACGFFNLRTPSLLIRSPNYIESILVKNFSSFHDNNNSYVDKESDPYFSTDPFFSSGTDWKTNRAAMIPMLSPGKVKAMFLAMKEIMKQMEDYLENNSENIDAKHFATLFTSDIIANCVFGIQSNSFLEGDNHIFRKLNKKVMESFHNPLKGLIFVSFPRIAKFLRCRLVPDSAYTFLKEVIMQVKEFRETNHIVRNDFINALLSAYNKAIQDNDGCIENPEVLLLGRAISFFIEGVETSAITISYILYELAVNPKVQETLKKEILSAFSKREDIEYETLQNLPYLNKVISETLRKYPPVLVLKKKCTENITLDMDGTKLEIEKGTPEFFTSSSLQGFSLFMASTK
uniref:Cytochrome P450 n=1 Tax=Clastoptera arizonana TaxID=38151 RepID=A0A1B6DGU0_9HEMI